MHISITVSYPFGVSYLTAFFNPTGQKNMGTVLEPDKAAFTDLLTARMPFGKYSGQRLVDLPERYLVWFHQKGFPAGKLGEQLQTVYEIKRNGLEYLFKQRP